MSSLNLGIVSAYADAKRGGYTGTYDDFCALLAGIGGLQPKLTAGQNISITGNVIDTKAFPCSPNLLDNWYFPNPVNQRGASGTISTAGYFFDRWKLVSGSVTINSGGIVLNGTIAQVLEYAVGQTVTATVLTPDGVTDVTPVYDDETKTFTVTAQGKTIRAVKLELGSVQTLAHQDANGAWVLNEIPDYGEQLRRCQMYYFKTASAQYSAYMMRKVDDNYLMDSCIFPVTMRTTPSVQLVSYRKPTTGAVITAEGDALQITPDGFCIVNDAGKFADSSAFQVAFSASADL